MTGREAQIDRDVDDRARALVLDAVRWTWASTTDVAVGLPAEVKWRARDLLVDLVERGQVEWRRATAGGYAWRLAVRP